MVIYNANSLFGHSNEYMSNRRLLTCTNIAVAYRLPNQTNNRKCVYLQPLSFPFHLILYTVNSICAPIETAWFRLFNANKKRETTTTRTKMRMQRPEGDQNGGQQFSKSFWSIQMFLSSECFIYILKLNVRWRCLNSVLHCEHRIRSGREGTLTGICAWQQLTAKRWYINWALNQLVNERKWFEVERFQRERKKKNVQTEYNGVWINL